MSWMFHVVSSAGSLRMDDLDSARALVATERRSPDMHGVDCILCGGRGLPSGLKMVVATAQQR